MELFQHTLAKKVDIEGEGVLSGAQIRVEFCPAPPNHGIVFERADLPSPVRIPVRPENVKAVSGASVLVKGGVEIYYVEHLLAALNGLAVDNLLVRVFGGEIPLFDGSAKPFVEAILRAGRKPLWSLRRYIRLEEEIVVSEGQARVCLRPAEGLKLRYLIDFPHPSIGKQEFSLELSQERFLSEVSFARTFAFLKDILPLRKAGVLKGGSLESALVLDDKQVLNPDGLKKPNEFVRHKVLDLLGDLYLLGAPLLAEVEARYATHRLHIKAVKTVLRNLYAWRWYPSPARAPLAVFSLPAYAA